MTHRIRIIDVAEYVRTKNAGPFRLTIDIVFKRRADYEAVKEAGVLTPALIAGLYGVTSEEITDFVAFDPGKAFKATMRRRVSSGSPADTDVYGAQQHAPLLDLQVERPNG